MRPNRTRRDWSGANAKIAAEPQCRVCRATPVQRCHVLPRRYDERLGDVLVVTFDDVWPGCASCHTAYDEHRLDLRPYLTAAEFARAFDKLPRGEALRIIGGRAFIEDSNG
jgi:hypothetical protein